MAILEQLAEKGVRAVFVATAGYREADSEGAIAERLLVETAIRLGLTLAGPNGQGLVHRVDQSESRHKAATSCPPG